MPIYEFECISCGISNERYFPRYKPNLKIKCKGCGKMIKKKISKCSFILEGAGWPGKEVRERNIREHLKEVEHEESL